ncbi:hypothetical protein [Rhodanobacter sp. FW106-PBR-R2A-1-13]|uniref:hypothetical protein n=1 Tax=Rhodanobacter sp. FW106-PBR-R2A-1-13 TaxID=3454845 RepID=UPI0034E5FA07
MSSTITVSRRAAAFRSGGITYLALFENTFESNVSPRTPRESCVAFGTARQVNAWILQAMSSCVSGCLRGRGGSLTPMGYLRSWRAALAMPQDLTDRDVILSPGPEAQRAVELLSQRGNTEVAAQSQSGLDLRLRLHADAAILADIYGGSADHHSHGPWRILRPVGLGEPRPDLAHTAVPRQAANTALPTVYSTPLKHPHDGEPIHAFQRRGEDALVLVGEWEVKVYLLAVCAHEAELADEGAGLAIATGMFQGKGIRTQPLPADATLTYRLKGICASYVDPFLAAVAASGALSDDRKTLALPAQSVWDADDEQKRQFAILKAQARVRLPAVAADHDHPAFALASAA